MPGGLVSGAAGLDLRGMTMTLEATREGGTVRFPFDNSYARLPDRFRARLDPTPVAAPRLLKVNAALAERLGLDPAALASPEGVQILAGNQVPEGAEPIAAAYAGHQFGGFSPQLGDGRAILLGETTGPDGVRRDIALKGSGRTPFSRGGDGKAAVGPMLREALFGEAMHALGVPTTRALAVVATGESVFRERVLPGAVLTRVAASHIRVGTFQFFAARGDLARVQQLADYAIARHDADLVSSAAEGPERYRAFLGRVAERQAALIARWMNVGFIHGVMNTDNMAISGETIDYGPCAFLEAYDPRAVFSSIDTGGRYAYGNQPAIARWNITRLAECLLPLLGEDDAAQQAAALAVIDAFPVRFARHWRDGQRAKLGLAPQASSASDDETLADDWLALLQSSRADFTLAWRRLADAAAGDDAPLRRLVSETTALDAWLGRWRSRASADGVADAERAARMRRVNPWLVPRHPQVEAALSAASDDGNMARFDALLAALREPYDERPERAAFAEPASAAATACYRTFCGT
jgi:uncharacterized protein YdiU (UPF0061 family)